MTIIHTLLSHYLRSFNDKHMRLKPMSQNHPLPRRDKPYLLYVHIPFCESLCPYCSFHRVKFEAAKAEQYFQALRKELLFCHLAGFDFSEIYVGGGTPTVMPKHLAAILELAGQLFNISRISVETNPNHLREPILKMLLDSGVKRLSVGVQSLEDDLLQEMERFTPYGSAREILQRLEYTQGQFETFNVDMMFNFPHQSVNSLLRDITRLKRIQVDQISYYPLMPARITRQQISKRIGSVDFKREYMMYQAIDEVLREEYAPTTAWCYTKQKTNSIIDEYLTEQDEFLGIGSGAFSYLNGSVYSSSFSINQYIELIQQGLPGMIARRELSLRERALYDFLVKLFGRSLRKSELGKKYGESFKRLLGKEILIFKKLGAVEETDNTYRLTRKGQYYWVLMMREFFMAVNNLRMQMRDLAVDPSHEIP